jgi:hypothetical protein
MRFSFLLALPVVTVTGMSEPGVSAAAPPTSTATCRECDQVVSRVLRLLPQLPEAIVVIDADRSSPALRQSIEHFQGFVTEGEGTVYLRKQAPIFQRALQGASVWDYALACTVWHEMAHIAGADERDAQRREEELCTRFLVSGKVEAGWGQSYLQQLRKRHREETRTHLRRCRIRVCGD